MATAIPDQIIHTTARIETDKGRGTGFSSRSASKVMVANYLITNRHVVDGKQSGRVRFTLATPDGQGPDFGKHVDVPIANFSTAWIKHPSQDLAALPIASMVKPLVAAGQQPFYRAFDSSWLADAAYMSDLMAVEDIKMVGYPIGVWDSQNNLPVVRSGITATPPYIDFEGRPQFLIDCACFPGSSGSPVFLANMGDTWTSRKYAFGEHRSKLLGVLFAGPQFSAKGDIKVVPVPTSSKRIVSSKIPANLGYCIKASELLWFEQYFDGAAKAAAAASTP